RILGSNLFTKDIPIELLCELSWLNFDAVNFAGTASNTNFQNLMSLCDTAGVYYSISPTEVMQYVSSFGDSTYSCWFRYSDSTLTSDHCFAQCNTDFDSIVRFTTAESLYYDDPDYSIETTIIGLAQDTDDHDFLWFYEVYDEANSQQGKHVADDPDSLIWNDYIPNVYTQDRQVGSGEMLSFEEVETSGIFSIQKFYAENDITNPVTFTLNFALIHFIDKDDYTGLTEDRGWGEMDEQAACVRAMMEAEYLFPPPDEDSLVANAPDFIMFDYYPFRYVHIDYASSTEMCDDDWLFLIEHFEEGIDSTVIPAWEDSVPVFFFPQTFGVAGGTVMWDDDALYYQSYWHRKPAPQEFRMLCNLALLHQAKGIFPYNLTSYLSPYGPGQPPSGRIMSSLLDLHNIPFDASYEEWVYTGRWSDEDFVYVRPDSLPPWIDGFDPLYDVSDPPDTLEGDQQADEKYLQWLCEPYADLYNNLGGILADVKWIGPEMHDLWWCSDDYYDGAEISYDGITPGEFVTPVIKVFEDEAQETCYLFYVDRYCISDNNPYEITFSPNDLPGYADCTTRLLDHSRRFIMDGTYSSRETLYTFLDTLDAGESRLVQLVDLTSALPADVRITSSDIRTIQAADSLRLEATVGDSVDIYAYFYNMGTASRDSVFVTLFDSTDSNLIGSDTLEFDGLGYFLPSACRSCDRSTASFSWTPDSLEIGVHRLTASAATWHGEPDSSDNSVDFVFLVNPRDYATEVRGDAWDMTEGGSNDWNTDDIEAIAENWNTSTGWTDSVSGMFEGVIDFDTLTEYFEGEISLAIPDSVSKYINTGTYHMLSFGIVVNNPNTLSDNACSMKIAWRDALNNWNDYVGLLAGTGYHVGNGWDRWSVIGPIDLKADTSLHWGNGTAKELWIRFQYRITIQPEPLDTLPLDIRIGWIRLEESAQ
ncbi:MAG: hypothetical protein KAR44_13030, partial [Candidatus Aegiribacteria sp.]|nr:hypothetical protein [Candidatus Aegiribacteria sp.]